MFAPARSRSGAVLALAIGLTGQATALAQREAEGLSASFRKAAEKALPAVVAIRSATPMVPTFIRPGFRRPMLGMEMGLPPGPGGSGFIVDARRGLILTTASVVRESARITVLFSDSRRAEVQRVVQDPQSDLAVLVIDPRAGTLASVEWGDSGSLEMGDWVLAIGRTTNGARAISAGIVSGRETARDPSQGAAGETIRSDVRLPASGVGGPLVNLAGQVVGISRLPLDPVEFPDGLGHAIPSEWARRVASELIEHGHIRRGYLGLTLGPELTDLPGSGPGLLVTAVAASSPASEAGIQIGDRLIAVDGHPVTGLDALSHAVEAAPIGQEFRISIDRNGVRKELSLKTRPRPEVPGALPVVPVPRPLDRRLRPSDRGDSAPRPIPPRRNRPLQSEGPADEPSRPSPPPPLEPSDPEPGI